MRVTIALAVIASVGVVAAPAAAAAKRAAMDFNHTSWSFVDDGNKLRMAVDSDGRYVEETVAGKHRDHGSWVMKDDKICFTSAMNNEGEDCWTSKSLKVGQSMLTKSDKGKTLTVTRVAYKPLAYPK